METILLNTIPHTYLYLPNNKSGPFSPPGGFIIVGMFNISGGKHSVSGVLPPGVACDPQTSTLHLSFKLSSVAVSLLGVAGIVATLASILEKGDAHQSRNRKGEEAAAEAAAVAQAEAAAAAAESVTISPPASPSPPSTISDNESTPLSFDSVFESDGPYMGSNKKRVSFQQGNRRGQFPQSPHMLNSISAGAPVCNIPVSYSAPHVLQPVPQRRLSAQSVGGHNHIGRDLPLTTNRRQSSPLRYNSHQPTMGQRTDSLSSRGSNQSVVVGRRPSNGEKHYGVPSTRSSNALSAMTQSSPYSRDGYGNSHSHSRRSSRT